MCISVDLPEPDGPMTATYSPSSMLGVDPAQRVDPDRAGVVGLADPASSMIALTGRLRPGCPPPGRAAARASLAGAGAGAGPRFPSGGPPATAATCDLVALDQTGHDLGGGAVGLARA